MSEPAAAAAPPLPSPAAPCCARCGKGGELEKRVELYFSGCSHLTLCLDCGKGLVQGRAPCGTCGKPFEKLIKEFTVRSHTVMKKFFVGKFPRGLPNFRTRKKTEKGVEWRMQRDLSSFNGDLSGKTEEDFARLPWALEDRPGHATHTGTLDRGQVSKYYLLMQSSVGDDFMAIPAGEWYNFAPTLQYSALEVDDAEKLMLARKDATQYANQKLARAVGDHVKAEEEAAAAAAEGGGGGRGGGSDDDGGAGPGDDDGGARPRGRKMKRSGGRGAAGGAREDGSDDDSEKGEDWEHEDEFTDDDEAVGAGEFAEVRKKEEEEEENMATEEGAAAAREEEDEDDEEDEAGKGGAEDEEEEDEEIKAMIGKAGLESSDDDDYDLDNDLDDSPVFLGMGARGAEGGEEAEGMEVDAEEGKADPSAAATPAAATAAPTPDAANADASAAPAAAAAAAAPTLSGKKRGRDGNEAAVGAAGAAGPPTEITEDAVRRAILGAPGKRILPTELSGKFQELYAVDSAKAQLFRQIVKRVGKIKEIPAGSGNKYIVIRT